MNGLPWFPCYAADWKNDHKLKGLSLEARGFWHEICLSMWLSDEPGYLPIQPGTDEVKVLADEAKIGRKTADKLRQILIDRDILRRDSRGFLFSKRLVEEAAKLLEKKRKRSAAGQLGAIERWGQPDGNANGNANGNAINPPMAMPMPNQCDGNGNQNHSQSHSTERRTYEAPTEPVSGAEGAPTDEGLPRELAQEIDPAVRTKAPAPDYAGFTTAWNKMADELGLTHVDDPLVESYRNALRSRWPEWEKHGGFCAVWPQIVAGIKGWKFGRGEKGWKVNASYLLRNDHNWHELVERGRMKKDATYV